VFYTTYWTWVCRWTPWITKAINFILFQPKWLVCLMPFRKRYWVILDFSSKFWLGCSEFTLSIMFQIKKNNLIYLCSMKKLLALSLENNKFTWTIPTKYALKVNFSKSNSSLLERLLLGGNYLFGPIPGVMMGLKGFC